MPRITRIHFAGLGHQDARFPSLTLDLRDSAGRAADSVIWAENGTGKSSLLSLFFSTYRPSQRLFLGKQAEGKARELGDYLRERDLGFVITEWDATDDRAEASLLTDGPREMLLVGQCLSWRDRATGDLRRLFFTLRAGRDVNFESLPVLGLGRPVASLESFREWLDSQTKAHPRLAIVHTSNQTEWRDHLENNHLDPELFTFQLRMNEREGGINNLFNDLKRDAEFIHEFLKLGFDPATANEVRANLDAFLPKLRRRELMELQLDFDQKLLGHLGIFLQQLAEWESAKKRGETAERQAGSLLASLTTARDQLAVEITKLYTDLVDLERDKTRLESARTANGRRQNFFRRLKAQLEVGEAESELKRCRAASAAALENKRLVEMALLLRELAKLNAEAQALRAAISKEEVQARPVLESLQTLGAAYKLQLGNAAEAVKAIQLGVENQLQALRTENNALLDQRTELVREQSAKQQASDALDAHFVSRETHRERQRREGWLEPKEAATDALGRWRNTGSKARALDESVTRELAALRSEQVVLTDQAIQLSADIATAQSRADLLARQVQNAELEEERIATHDQMRAAIETSRADLNLPQSAERLAEHAALLFRQVLRLNVEGAEDQRAQASVDKQRLFPSHHDVEAIVERLKAAGVRSATTAAQWLAYNFTDPQAATELLASDPAKFGGVFFDAASDGPRVPEALAALRTEQLAIVVAPAPASPAATRAVPELGTVVTPRHTGTINFATAQAEGEKLAGLIAARAKEIETLNSQLNATRTLIDCLHTWLDQFGGTKLTTLREKSRAEHQNLALLQERRRQLMTREHDIKSSIDAAAISQEQQRVNQKQADTAVVQLEHFIERFDADYEAKRAQQTELRSRLQVISVQLPLLTERIQYLAEDQKPLQARLMQLAAELIGVEKEIAEVVYSTNVQTRVAESLDHLRAAYKIQVQQYEGRFLNSKAQGQLTAKLAEVRAREQDLATQFADLDQALAAAKVQTGDLPGQLQSAQSTFNAAQKLEGAAELKLETARTAFKDLGVGGEQERPGQADLIPAKSREAKIELSKLESEYDELQRQIEINRNATQSATEAKTTLTQRAADYQHFSDRLRDQRAPEGHPAVDLPPDETQVRTQTEECLQQLRRTRGETQAEHQKLAATHSNISDLTTEERFAKATDLPARSLFVHMPLEELILCAPEKQKAVNEEALVLQADLDQMHQHRETLVESLLNVCEQAARLLHRAEKWSVLPADMGEWSRLPFLRIRLRLSPNRTDNLARLKSLFDLLFAENKIPTAIDLVFRGLTALVGETGIDATILKPETQRRQQRYPVREMGSWSEGERTTVAILLYCTLVRIRAQSRGHAARRTELSALLLDNPVGPCSKPEFLQMHRWIASQLGVQLIYATGINDPAALSVFPNRIRLAKNRFIPATGELAVAVQSDPEASVIQDIRIFDGNEDAVPNSRPSNGE